MPSAFIPFCAINNNLATLGKTMANFTYPVCSSFSPTIMEGQLCYQLLLSHLHWLGKEPGSDGGLMVIVDYNTDRSLPTETSVTGRRLPNKTHLVSRSESKTNQMKVHMDTLSPYTGHGPGLYIISAIKHVTVSENILELPQHSRGCVLIDSLQDCRSHKYKDLETLCDCIPFGLNTAYNSKVIIFYDNLVYMQIHILS